MVENSPADTERELRPRTAPHVSLDAVVRAIGATLLESGDVERAHQVTVQGVCLNSRAVQPGDLYAALPGAKRHGSEFAAQALAAGAVGILTDDDAAARLQSEGSLPADTPIIVTEDPRKATGIAAQFIYGTTPEAPSMFGVTGTNGKTTTTYFLRALLRALGHKTGLIGTIEIVADEEVIPSVLTTPEASQLHGILARMRESGVTAAAMEVSSHAIEFRRIEGLNFKVAGFSNLTQDHLDLHGTMEEYFAAKAKLFTPEFASCGVVLIDSEWGARIAQAARDSGLPVITFATPTGTPTEAADWTVANVERSGLGHNFSLTHRDGRTLRAHTGLPGDFNVANAALALTMMVAADLVPLEVLQKALDEHDPLSANVPGRMEVVGHEPASIVDFAHNPDAMVRALEAVRPGTSGRVIVVFGATGERDQAKRPIMGAIAARGADVVIVTDDDPHDEDEQTIRTAVMAGVLDEAAAMGAKAPLVREVFPRAEAIEEAVRLAKSEDTILVAGRGHEIWQEVKGVNLPLDDRQELRDALSARSGFGIAHTAVQDHAPQSTENNAAE
ncbi:UDP-N-acetylmuramoyl-L-alanyl-D-glutamate--2,6-diaminopimelate ligase [Neomicrococcus aestuarii]|uniref:UDP-N-acetylmuramyl-tripeptide synthetase n=1 Tax=Neomicrococcus aestuarii TaxID=556325 RepID=A0A7W8TVM7_9MICC|nr:UDP-N-acetylmuramoyl-L-alanyl-D-glutamate--2,6-diaminopimelate ligase [Neomicrococcus aestuarii]MBB5513750.1 UDP-N-acetylmuramoyl-L-alanyl-D-glutamate--2,6-diaminopimelate ligase [Neomicrococcus aestuarii]